jgi:hypothetical protein
MRRTAAAEGIGVSLVWRIIHEQSRYPYHSQQLQSFMFANSFPQNAM